MQQNATPTWRNSRRGKSGKTNVAKSFDELVKRTTTKKTRAKAACRTRELLGEVLLSEVRQLTGKSQHDVATTLGMKQPSLSKLEKQGDMQISTLRKIIKALGGELEVLARFPRGTIRIEQFGQRKNKKATARQSA